MFHPLSHLAMFMWIVVGPQSFAQVENRFTLSLRMVHIKFYEVLKCLRKLAKHNITPKVCAEHERVREDRFWTHFKDAIGAIDGSHIAVIVPWTKQLATHVVMDTHLRMCWLFVTLI
jgi:ABC-type transport system involved in cytochrome bd biosynthesis fused ATPase/permease subunit